MNVVLTTLALLASAGCSDRGDEARALAAFESFQHSLFQGDRATTRELLTRGSRPLVDYLPWHTFRDLEPLVALGVEHTNDWYEIRVRDPNEGDRETKYVVVEQDSNFRVDLMETTVFNHRERALPGPATRLVRRQLNAQEFEEFAAREASMIR